MSDPKSELPFLSEPEIRGSDGTLEDALQRNPLLEQLTNIVKNVQTPFTISINGGWGTGKTHLMHLWKQQLKKEMPKSHVIYFNAWKDDFFANPLVSIVGQIINDLETDDKKKWEKLAGTLKRTATVLAKATAMMVTKSVIPVINEKTISDIQKKLTPMGDIIDNYTEATKETEELKKALQELAEKIKTESEFPLVFIIDELDRCRPTFAIEVLERVKHIFSVPGVVFILVMNAEPLEESICHIYGNINAKDYLRRFYNTQMTVPNPISSDYCRHLLSRHVRLVNSLTRESKEISMHWKQIEMYYPLLFDYIKLSLRETEHAFRLLDLSLAVTRDYSRDGYRGGWAATCLILLKIKNSDLYFKLIRKQIKVKQVITFFEERIPQGQHRDFLLDAITPSLYEIAPQDEWQAIWDELQTTRAYGYPPCPENYPNLVLRSLDRNNNQGLISSSCKNDVLKKISAVLDLAKDK